MNPFTYARAGSVQEAVKDLHDDKHASFIAGGTNILDLMKENVARPERLVDITHLPLNRIEDLPNGGLRLGALVTNNDTAYHPAVESRYPLLNKAILAGASPQLRNMATNGGNLLQRTRCYYFYDALVPCNKREPGTGCPAIQGLNRIHAVLGQSDHCIAVHPSDMAVALAALEAVVQVTGPDGPRSIPFADFHRLPGNSPHIDTTLGFAELITSIDLPPNPFAQNNVYLKLRDRASYAFALISVAAAVELDGNTIKQARIALGGVAHKPWRDTSVEQMLAGATPSVPLFQDAAEAIFRQARGYQHNTYKIELGKRAVIRALKIITNLQP